MSITGCDVQRDSANVVARIDLGGVLKKTRKPRDAHGSSAVD